MVIGNYGDFTSALLDAGFSIGMGSDEGVYSVGSLFGPGVVWHTGNRETDPWEWRMRVLEERDDIAYAKVFFRKSGWITREWYPCFLTARRGGKSFGDAYGEGTVSRLARRVYDCVSENGALPVHTIKRLAGIGGDEQTRFERALVELQMGMFLTMCGRRQKTNRFGVEYGWSSTVFCAAESFFGEEVFEKAARMPRREAVDRITEQVRRLNPAANDKKILKFISG